MNNARGNSPQRRRGAEAPQSFLLCVNSASPRLCVKNPFVVYTSGNRLDERQIPCLNCEQINPLRFSVALKESYLEASTAPSALFEQWAATLCL
jgi:hypothetical protein